MAGLGNTTIQVDPDDSPCNVFTMLQMVCAAIKDMLRKGSVVIIVRQGGVGGLS